MAHLIMGHNASGCFGTSLAPISSKNISIFSRCTQAEFPRLQPGFRFVVGIILGSPLLDSLLYRM